MMWLIYGIALQYDPTETDSAKLQQLFKVAKKIMKSRSDQVEEAMEEMEKEAKRSKKKGLFFMDNLKWWAVDRV